MENMLFFIYAGLHETIIQQGTCDHRTKYRSKKERKRVRKRYTERESEMEKGRERERRQASCSSD